MNLKNRTKFVLLIDQLLDKREVDFYQDGLNELFELACITFFETVRRGVWYDGVVDINIRKRKQRQLGFTGSMWVAQGPSRQWKEPFHARVTDKRLTKQGLWLFIKVGNYQAEGDVLSNDQFDVRF